MALKKSEKRLLLLLAAVGGLFVINQMLSGNKKKAPPPPSGLGAGRTIPAQTETIKPKPSRKGEAKLPIDDTWGRNPFLSPQTITRRITASEASGDSSKSAFPELKGIIWKGPRVYVLIDDKIIAPGEEKGGIRVLRVVGNEVICVKDGVQMTLRLKG